MQPWLSSLQVLRWRIRDVPSRRTLRIRRVRQCAGVLENFFETDKLLAKSHCADLKCSSQPSFGSSIGVSEGWQAADSAEVSAFRSYKNMAQFWVGSSVVLSLQQRLDCTEFGSNIWPNIFFYIFFETLRDAQRK